ncbi:hypothetical protein MRB53_034782 [Persea americana]|uniref:Uncharacterized protein n=1 Tax=Persea americana TaxID=3435 RepID=A0ACC2K2U9_PERAE|nr:hypothetical protein MRB53_034782 [Persea americana]
MQSREVKNPNLQKAPKEETGKDRNMELWREDLQLSKEKAEPSRRLTMWVRTFDGKAEMVLAPLDLGVV